MYYEEAVIDGVLHYRTTPDGKWIAKTAAQLTEALMEARRKPAQVQPVIVSPTPVVYPAVQPVVLPMPTWLDPPYKVTC